jgi:hypothetical protein
MEPFEGIKPTPPFLNGKVSWVYKQVHLNRVPRYEIGAFRRFKLSELEA